MPTFLRLVRCVLASAACLVACVGVDVITIDPGTVLAPGAGSRLGTGTITWFDSDRFNTRSRPLATGLRELGARVLRYGCSIAVWSTPPYERPRPTPARRGDPNTPWSNRSIFAADGSYVPDRIMDLDEFIATPAWLEPSLASWSPARRDESGQYRTRWPGHPPR